MQVGDTERDITSVLLTTDITETVVSEAITRDCQLIISHHPLLFHGLKQVCGQTPQARIVEMAIKNNIAIYSAHTNLGQLTKPMNYLDFIEHIRDILESTYVRYTRPVKDQIQTVALCGGSGAEFIETAIEQGADVYLTADVKYHEFQDADGRIGLIDIDHWISERHARDIFADILAPLGVKTYISKNDKTPIQVWQEQKN